MIAKPEPVLLSPQEKSRLFLRLFLQNQRRLYAHILMLRPNRADADDLLQETSLVMWDKFDANDPPADFLAWGRRIAYHKVLDFYKKSKRAKNRLTEVFLERVSALAGEAAAIEQADLRRDALAGCLEKLPERSRELLKLRFSDGATTQSTSEQVGKSVDVVYKALAKLRQNLFDCVQNSLAREGRS